MVGVISVKLLIFLLLLGFFGAASISLKAQDAAATELRPLDDLLADALQNSPLLKYKNLNAALLYSEIQLLKKEWSNYVALSGTFQVGNLQFIDSFSGGTAPVQTVQRDNIFMVAGLSIRLPLSDFLTRKERLHQLDIRLEQERYLVQEQTLQIRELVIRQYNDWQRATRNLAIRSDEATFHELTTQMAERYFRDGAIELTEYSNAHTRRSEALVRKEEAMIDAQLAYMLLRELVGTEIKR